MSKQTNQKGKKDKSAPAPAKKTKPVRTPGRKPDFTPRSLRAAMPPIIQNDLKIIWKGWDGLVEVDDGTQFLVKNEVQISSDGGRNSITKVFLHFAPAGSELSGLAGSDVYLTVGQIRRHDFVSRLVPDSKMYVTQKRIWDFLSGKLTAQGFFKQVPLPSISATGGSEIEVSTSTKDFLSGKVGLYCFDAPKGPRAVMRIRVISRVGKEPTLVTDVMSVEFGHELRGCRNAYVFFNLLTWTAMPNFKGTFAGAQVKIWEYLTDRIAEYRKSVDVSEKKNNTKYVVYMTDRRVA